MFRQTRTQNGFFQRLSPVKLALAQGGSRIRRLGFELLEDRVVLAAPCDGSGVNWTSVTFAGTTISVTMTDQDDMLSVGTYTEPVSGTDFLALFDDDGDGVRCWDSLVGGGGPAAGITKLSVEALAGNDQVDLSGMTVVDFPSLVPGGPAGGQGTWVNGNSGYDQIVGTYTKDELHGGIENDRIVGRNGDDEIHGEGGHDTLLSGGGGNDTITGGDGTDEIWGGLGNDTIDGNDAFDFLWGDAGSDTITGGPGSDQINGGADNDYLYGDEDEDRILGETGADDMHGGGGNDTLKGGPGNDILSGDYGFADDGLDLIEGNEGNDTIDGGDKTDVLWSNGPSGPVDQPWRNNGLGTPGWYDMDASGPDTDGDCDIEDGHADKGVGLTCAQNIVIARGEGTGRYPL